MSIETIIIENLKCGGCANTIMKNVKNMDKVLDVDVNIEKSEIQVTHNGDLDREIIVSTLGKLGYPEVGTGTTTQKIKSYVSCAVGRMNL